MANISDNNQDSEGHTPWNKGKITGQKPPLKPQAIWSIRVLLRLKGKIRDLALFNLAIDSKLRGCDIVKIRVSDVMHGQSVKPRASEMQEKTGQLVRFEITEQSRDVLNEWITMVELKGDDYLFSSRVKPSTHITTRQYSSIVKNWIKIIGLDPSIYGTHSIRRTKASLIYKRTKNLRAVQLLFGHTTLESTVRYLGVEVDDALEMAEQTEV